MPQLIDVPGQGVVEFPDGMSDDAITQAIQRNSAPPAPAAPQPVVTPPAPQPSSPGRSFMLGAEGVGRGLAHAAGTPVDLATAAINAGTTGINKAAGLFGYHPDIQPIVDPFMGGNTIQRGAGRVAEMLGGPLPTEQTPNEKLIGNIEDYGTQALTMGSGLAARAPAIVDAVASGAKPASSALGRLFDTISRPYIENAGRTVAGDVAGGVGAGAANSAVDEYMPEGSQGPIAHLLATLAGGMAGSTVLGAGLGAGRLAAKATVGTRANPDLPLNPLTSAPYTNNETDTAARMMQSLASDPAAAARTIAENTQDFRAAGLPTPTTGLVSGDTGLMSAEAAGRTKNGVPFIQNDNKLRAAATDRVDSLRDPGANLMEPRAVAQTEASLRTREAQDTAQQGVRQADAEASQRLRDAQAAARTAEDTLRNTEQDSQRLAAPLAPAANADARAQASGRLHEAVVEPYQAARAAKNDAFNAIDPQRTQQVDATPVIEAARRVRQGINDLGPAREQLPAEFVQRIEALAPDIQQQPSGILGPDGRPLTRDVNVGGPGTAALGDLVDVRKYMNTAYEAAVRGGNFDLADNISDLRRAIGTTVGAAPEAAAASAQYRQFADTYRPNQGDEAAKFTRQVDRRQEPPPSATAGRFLSSPEKTQALQRMLNGSPEGETAARDYLRSDFAMAALNPNGTLNPNRAAAWSRNNADVLAQFPQIRGEFDGMVTAARRGEDLSTAARTALDEARGGVAAADRQGQSAVRGAERSGQQRVQATQQELDRSAVGTLLKEDPRDIASKILRGGYGAGKQLDEINGLIGKDEAARRGWRAAVSEVVADQVSGTAKIDSGSAATGQTYRTELGKLDKVFKDNEQILAKVYGPEDMSKLRQAQAVLEPLKNASVRATAGSNTGDKAAQVWRLAEAGLRAKFGALKGGSYMRTLRIMAQTLPDDSENISQLITKAWFDPDVARQLLTHKVIDLNAEGSNKFVGRAMAITSGQRAAGKQDQN